MKSAAFLAAIMMCAGTRAARAQDFSSIQLKNLPVVFVEDRSGAETRGRLLSITPNAITIAFDTGGAQRVFAPADVAQIERRGDSLKNGALIGAAVGLFTGFLGDCPRGNPPRGCAAARVSYVFGGAAVWAGIGAGIDALIPGRSLLWKAPPK